MLRVSAPGLRTLCKKYGCQDFGLTRTHYLIEDSYPRLPVTQGGGPQQKDAEGRRKNGWGCKISGSLKSEESPILAKPVKYSTV